MKKLFFSALASVLSILVIQAQQTEVFTLTNNSPLNLLSAGKLIDNVAILATTANNTTVKFYDSATAITNYVQAAYTRYYSYATNFSSTFTNNLGALVTNTFVGVYRVPVAVAGSTQEMTKVTTIMVPASALLSRDLTHQTTRGLTAVSDQNAVVTITYRNPQ